MVLTHPKVEGFLASQFRLGGTPSVLVLNVTDLAAAMCVNTPEKRMVFDEIWCPGHALEYQKAPVVPWVLLYASGEVSVVFLDQRSSYPIERFLSLNGTMLDEKDFVLLETASGDQFIPRFGTQMVLISGFRVVHFNSTYYHLPYHADIIPGVRNLDVLREAFKGTQTLTMKNGDTFFFAVQPTVFTVDRSSIIFEISGYTYTVKTADVKSPYHRECFVEWISNAEALVIDKEVTEFAETLASRVNPETVEKLAAENKEIRASRGELPTEADVRSAATKATLYSSDVVESESEDE